MTLFRGGRGTGGGFGAAMSKNTARYAGSQSP
jgi:hypothetical protein